MSRYPVAVMRGGTSRALVFRAEDLPADTAVQDRIFLAALGCPDPTGRQVDGLGGGASSNNKVAIVGPSAVPGIDVDFAFGQLSPDRDFVDRAANCGNISSAIGPFAIEEEMVTPRSGETAVAIRNTNSGARIVAHVPTRDGFFDPRGSFAIAGVAGTGSRIVLDFVEPAGPRGPLPSGRPVDRLEVEGLGAVRCSLVDAGKAGVMVPFEELGIDPSIRPEDLDSDPGMLERIEAVRVAGAVAMGAAVDRAAATATPSAPHLAFFAPAAAGALRVLAVSMGRPHRSLPLTAAVAFATAASLPGTLVAAALDHPRPGDRQLHLDHPSGRMEVGASPADGAGRPAHVSISRTARRLFDGVVYVDPATQIETPAVTAPRGSTGRLRRRRRSSGGRGR